MFALVSGAAHASFHSMQDIQRDGGVNTVTAMNMAGYINGSVCKQTALDVNDEGMYQMFDSMVKANIEYLTSYGVTHQGQAYLNSMTSRYIFGLSLDKKVDVCNRIYAPLR